MWYLIIFLLVFQAHTCFREQARSETQICNIQTCCGYQLWTRWSRCSTSCGQVSGFQQQNVFIYFFKYLKALIMFHTMEVQFECGNIEPQQWGNVLFIRSNAICNLNLFGCFVEWVRTRQPKKLYILKRF